MGEQVMGKRRRLAQVTLVSILILIPTLLYVAHSVGARVHYADNPLALNWDNEGPYIFLGADDALSIEYIKVDADGGHRARPA